MDVEIVNSNLAEVSGGSVSEEGSLLHEKQNGMVHKGNEISGPIKFGSHSMDEPVIKEGNNAAGANFPKDAVDEWPATPLIHSFYFVKYCKYEEPELKVKRELAEKDTKKKNQERSEILNKIKAVRASRAELFDQLKPLNDENKQLWTIMDEKKKDMEPLHHALGKLRTSNSSSREKGVVLCSSEKQLNDSIRGWQNRIQHETIPLKEEKQILKLIRQLEGTREKVIANDAQKAKIKDSMGEEKDIEDKVKHMGDGLDEVRKEHQVVRDKRKLLSDEKVTLENEIKALEVELKGKTEKRDKAFDNLQKLRNQNKEGNTRFFHYENLLNNAKFLASKKDIQALKENSNKEVEVFMSLWNTSKAFRDDYEKRILSSLDFRQLSRDGRMRNPNEKPLQLPEAPTPAKVETVTKTYVKRPKEDSISTPQQDAAIVDKVQKEAKTAKNNLASSKTALEPIDLEDKKGNIGAEKLQKDLQSKQNEVDEAKLKEKRREAEIAKAKQALDRKKKLAEKAAAKAAIKAQKEAEKKLKEREKKLKKKSATSAPAPELEEQLTEADAEVPESQKVDENISAPISAPSKNKDRKGNAIRYKNRTKGPDSLPRVILKRKKLTNYWVWAAPVALAVLMLSVIGYKYLF